MIGLPNTTTHRPMSFSTKGVIALKDQKKSER
jgi:hypothetical protein